MVEDIERRKFLHAGLATCGTGLLNAQETQPVPPKRGTPSTEGPLTAQDFGESLSIRGYLSREAGRITDRALSYYTSPAAWRKLVPERRRHYIEMMGLEELPPYDKRPPLNVKVTGVVERPRYRIEKLYYESIPGLFVAGNLYVPNGLPGPAPTVLYVCGHGERQKTRYQAHARRFAELGFVCLLIETLEGEETNGKHHGPYEEGWFHWFSRGYTPAGIETLNGIRGIDLLVKRQEVDPKRIGVTGISGGGTYSWWIPAADERVKVCAPVCGTSTIASYVYDRTVDSNCDCMWWTNTYRWDLADVGGLIAPRPMLIADANRDIHFTMPSARKLYQQLRRLYTMLGAPENLSRLEGAGGHGYYPVTRTAVFSWFVKHLQGKNVPPAEVGDIDDRPESQESDETLRVYVNGAPVQNRATTIQDDFRKPHPPRRIETADDLRAARKAVVAELRRTSFAAFPAVPPPLRTRIEHEYEAGSVRGTIFRFTSEEGWRLRGVLEVSTSAVNPAPAIIGLRSPRDRFGRNDYRGGSTQASLTRISQPYAKIAIEPRGTGENLWGDNLEWHVRRASAMTGRTLPSMWVYDTLRALACVRRLPQVDSRSVMLAAGGEMAAVALYAALLDGGVNAVLLENPPATQDAPSPVDGRGGALEMLGCLLVTDLPEVAGLLCPAELVFAGERRSAYDWARGLYEKLGSAARFQQVEHLADWRPAGT